MADPNDHLKREATPSKFELVLDFIKSRLLTLAFLVAVLVALLAIFGIDLSAPRWLKITALTFVILAPYGYLVGNYITSLLYNPEHIFLIDLDARFLDGALYQFTADAWRELDVTEGQLCQLTPHLYTGKNVNLDESTVTGTWRGTLDDPDLLRALHKVDECRGELEEDAKRGFAIETQAWTIIRSATRAATLRVVQTFEEGTLPDEGNGLDVAIDEALSRYDLDERLRRVDTDKDDPTPKELEDIEPDQFDPDDDLADALDADPDLIDPGQDGRLSTDD